MIVTNHKSFLLFSASSDESQTVTKFDWDREKWVIVSYIKGNIGRNSNFLFIPFHSVIDRGFHLGYKPKMVKNELTVLLKKLGMEKSQIYLKQVKRGRNTKNNIGYYYIWTEKEQVSE